jgi:hypothetical protein
MSKTQTPPAAAFDADARAEAREQAPVVIGGVTYHRRRKDWNTTRAMRALLREQERAGAAQDRAQRLVDELSAAEQVDDAALDEAYRKLDEAGDAADLATYRLIALLLRTADGGDVEPELLQQSLDVQDAGPLAASLAGADPDPTPAAAGTATT